MEEPHRTGHLVGAGALCLLAMSALGLVVHERMLPLDAWLLRHAHARPGTLADRLAVAASGLFTLLSVAVLVVVAGQVWRRRRAARGSPAPAAAWRYLALLVLCASVLVLQNLFQRPGPPVVGRDYSYPSGHVSVVAALAFTAVVLAQSLPARWRAAVTVLESTALLGVGTGRLVLGEHYLGDVVGAVVGVAGVGLLATAALRLTPPVPAARPHPS